MAGAAAACGSPAASPTPAPIVAIPEGWATVSTTAAELQMALPPWLLVSDNHGAIFANELPRPPDNEIPMQLLAIPPGLDTQPRPGEDLTAWIAERLGNPGQGLPIVSEVNLPSGRAVRFERIDRAGTPTEWRILAFAIQTPSGVAYLQVDGLPDAWPGHAADVERIPFLVHIR